MAGRVAFTLTLAAVAWGAVLLVAGLTVGIGPDGETVAAESRLALAALVVTLGLTLVAGILLHLRCSRGLGSGGAWAAIFMLVGIAAVTTFSIGTFMIPLVLLLIASARLTPVPAR